MIQELRIGNYVCCRIGIENAKKYSPFGVIVSISEAHTCAINYNVPPEISSLFYKGKFEDDFTPITLTEDILLKCGFAGFAMLINDGDKFEVSPILGCAWYEALLISNRVTYLHQLQNLYFALTGEELICNLK